MSCPIIIHHRGASTYLIYTILTAKHSNPNRRIILIGNDSNSFFSAICEYHNEADYLDHRNKLENVYKHLSTHSIRFEFNALARWFVIEDFCLKHKIDRFLVIDSDMLIFQNISKLETIIPNGSIALYHEPRLTSGHAVYFSNFNLLTEYCEFVIDQYKYNLSLLESMQNDMLTRMNECGICDMTFWGMYRKRIIEMAVTINAELFDEIWDYNIRNDRVLYESGSRAVLFDKQNGIKSIRKYEKKRFLIDSKTEEKIELAALHFNGRSKKYMKNYSLVRKAPLLIMLRCIISEKTRKIWIILYRIKNLLFSKLDRFLTI